MPTERIKINDALWHRTTYNSYSAWVLACDPGGCADYTTLVALHFTVEPVPGSSPDSFIVNQAAKTLVQKTKRTFRVQGMTRLPLNLTIPQQADEVEAIRSSRPELHGCDVVVDATGLGVGLVDTLQERGMRPIHRIIFSGGDTENRLVNPTRISVPKVQIVAALDGCVQNGELEVAAGVSAAEPFMKEAESFRRAITQAGRTTLNAREGQHDDLVSALSLACWWARRQQHKQVYWGGVRGAY